MTVFALLRLRQLLYGATPRMAQASPCDTYPLGSCLAGSRAIVHCIVCPTLDAQRLRTLGLFEGVHVRVIDTRSGMVLDVRGSRLALGRTVVAGITVRLVSM